MTGPEPDAPRDHGGNIDAAMRRFGGESGDWIDLSTGINPVPYPLPPIPVRAWSALPDGTAMSRLRNAAGRAYATRAGIVPLAGAQAAIQVFPFLAPPALARILGPTYNEHAAALRSVGWKVEEVATLGGVKGADLAVVVNPNNPDGQRQDPEALLNLARSAGLLVVDESFADPDPGLSLGPHLSDATRNIVVLRSFGKFYGLAGVRLGFALTGSTLAARLCDLAGPWPVSGPAIEIGCAALADLDWQEATAKRLAHDAARLDTLATAAGWRLVGGTPLFRTYDASEAKAAQDRLARHRIWSRVFPYAPRWIRLGLAGSADQWSRLETAMRESP